MTNRERAAQKLSEIFKTSSYFATVSTIEALAAEIGVHQIQGRTVRGYFHMKHRQEAECLVAQAADDNPNFATELKNLWIELDAQEDQERGADEET